MRRHTARTTMTRTTPRLEALDDRALPSGMAGAQMMAALQEHRAALQQRRELRIEALQQQRQMRFEALQQRRELRLEALQQRRAPSATTMMTMAPQAPFAPQAGAPSSSMPSSAMTAPAASPASIAVAPVAAAPASTSSPLMAPAAAGASSAQATASASTAAGGSGAPQPVPNADPHLNAAYEDFLASNGGSFTTSQAGIIEVVGTSVGVDVHGYGGSQLVTELSNAGMTVQHVDGATGVVEGLLPLADLPAAARLPGVVGISPVYIPRRGGIF